MDRYIKMHSYRFSRNIQSKLAAKLFICHSYSKNLQNPCIYSQPFEGFRPSISFNYDLWTPYGLLGLLNPTIIYSQNSWLLRFPHRKQSLLCDIHGKMIYIPNFVKQMSIFLVLCVSHVFHPIVSIRSCWSKSSDCSSESSALISFFKFAKNDLCDETILLWYHQSESNIEIWFQF